MNDFKVGYRVAKLLRSVCLRKIVLYAHNEMINSLDINFYI